MPFKIATLFFVKSSKSALIQINFFIEHLLQEKLTEVSQLHSHLEALKTIVALDQQISFSYSEDNVIELQGPFSTQVDPTR